jgi:hypothetical protein
MVWYMGGLLVHDVLISCRCLFFDLYFAIKLGHAFHLSLLCLFFGVVMPSSSTPLFQGTVSCLYDVWLYGTSLLG